MSNFSTLSSLTSDPELPTESIPQVLARSEIAPTLIGPEPKQLFTGHLWTPRLTGNIFDVTPPAQARLNLPPPASLIPNTDTAFEHYFWPAKPSLLGCISNPERSPSFGGSFSDVWRYKIRFCKPAEALALGEVAVKVLRPVMLGSNTREQANGRMLQRLQQEAITWSGLDHPNIVPLIGWTITPNLSFILPWYRAGSLSANLEIPCRSKQLQLLLGIARGLEYLHSRTPPVAHGDLKPDNILLTDQGEPVLTDFGLSVIMGEEKLYTVSHRVGGSVPWMAPECMVGDPKSCQSDIYSFGSLAFTVMTGELPYDGLPDYQISLQVCHSNSTSGPVENWSRYPQLQGLVKELLMDCWKRSPSARPPMSAIIERLTTLLESRNLKSHTLPREQTTMRALIVVFTLALAVICIGPVVGHRTIW